MQSRVHLIYRKTAANPYTAVALAGILETIPREKRPLFSVVSDLEAIRPVAGGGTATLVCFSFMTPLLETVAAEVRLLRERRRANILLVAGGPHASADPEGTLALGFDIVFVGEAEETLPEALEEIRLEGPAAALARPVRRGSGRAVLDRCPPFSVGARLFGPIEIQRGCAYGCSYCQTPRLVPGPVRERTLAALSRSIEEAGRAGLRYLKFLAPNSLAYGGGSAPGSGGDAIRKLLLACRDCGIDQVSYGTFPSETRPDCVREDVLEAIADYATNRTIVVGIQSGSDRVLKRLHRGHTVEDGLRAVETLKRCGFQAHVDILFATPDETGEDCRLTLDLVDQLLRRHRARIHAHTFMPLPGSPLWGREPALLPEFVRTVLRRYQSTRRLDGWWEDQQKIASDILRWKREGLIRC
jgi:B12-binding domain/radical SAM domain protein